VRRSVVAALVAFALAGCVERQAPLEGVIALRKQGGSRSTPSEESLRDLTREITCFIESSVASGFEQPDQIVESVLRVYSDEQAPADFRPVAQRLISDAIRKQREDQAKWPAVTNCDRLDRAFGELESKGIVARQNFSDCGTCGAAEIVDEIQAVKTR
jgi:hypothetical protein